MGILNAVRAGLEEGAKRIKAYHGSPHDFDKFSTENIGTGEGAQAYGHGLYFAEREGTAKAYRDALSADTSFKKSDGAVFDLYDGSMNHPNIRRHMAKTGGDLDGSIEKAQKIIKDNSSSQSVDAATNDLSVLQKLKEDGGISQNKGSMYEVNIDASPDELLDWDKPLSQQSPKIQEIFPPEKYPESFDGRAMYTQIAGSAATGRNRAKVVGGTTESAAATSAKLNDLGIKGIKYADAQTRFSPKGRTNNYVMFDDKTIEIARKYGVSMPVAGAILAGTMTPEDAQAGALSAGKRIIESGFSKAMGGGSDRVGVLNKLETMQTGITDRSMGNIPNVNLYDFEGSPYLLTQSDRSAAGGVLESIHGKDIDPVDLRGGRDFMFDPPSEGQVWASDPGVIKTMHNRANALKKEYGADPLLLPFTMAPTGIDFATMPLDTMINYARQGMNKSDLKKMDQGIKKIIPEWLGVANPKSNDIFRQVHGSKRKLVEDFIDKNFRDVKGGLSMGEARAATSDSAQYVDTAGSLKNIGRIKADLSPIADSGHPTYVGGLSGEGLGVLNENLNARIFAEHNGRALQNDMSDIRSLGMRHQYSQGIIDEKLLRKIYDNTAVKGAAAGGVFASGGANANVPSASSKDGLLKDTGDVLGEIMAGANRGVVDALNFFTVDQVNAISQLLGSDKRVPTLYDAPYIKDATSGNFMEKGALRQAVRQGSEFLSPI
tara:strand:+ start:1651 stop:3801 length:2151 start_codon:yes stop_codon:yes gene_type:complete